MTVDVAGKIDEALYSKLTTAPGTAFYGTRVYDTLAPFGTPLPYVVFTQVAGGNDNLTPNPSDTVLYRIECIAANMKDARTGSGYIEQTFDLQYTLTIMGYVNYAMFEQRFYRLIDSVGGTQYYRRGQEYEIRIDQGS